MVRLIHWKREAEEQLDAALHYYMTTYSRNSASKLYDHIQERLGILIRYPESGRPIKELPDLRYVQIEKSHFLYYGYDDNSLFVVGLYGTKQPDNPFL